MALNKFYWILSLPLGLGLTLASPIMGQSMVYNEGADHFWSNPFNWTPFGTPTDQDSVLISTGQATIFQSYLAEAAYVEIASGAALKVKADISTSAFGNLTIRNSHATGLKNEGTLINHGEIIIEDADDYGILNMGMIRNDTLATITVDTVS